MLQGWLGALGIDHKMIGDADIYERLVACGAEKWDTTLCVDPVWWGERHTPEAKGSVTNMTGDNMTFSDWCGALHRGIIQNLSKMMPEEVLLEHKVCLYGAVFQHWCVCVCVCVVCVQCAYCVLV